MGTEPGSRTRAALGEPAFLGPTSCNFPVSLQAVGSREMQTAATPESGGEC